MAKGSRIVSFYYKHRDGTREQLGRARLANPDEVKQARREAIARGVELNDGKPADNTFAAIIDDYFKWQAALPDDSERKKAPSTITNNLRESKLLKAVFGKSLPDAITPQHIYRYQEGRELKKAGLAGNKEIALLSAIMEYGRRHGRIRENVAKGIKRVPSRPNTHRVEWGEIELLVAEAKHMGPVQTIMALAAKTAYLTVRRPPEIRGLTRPGIIDDVGIRFTSAKRKGGEAVKSITIEWSPELRATIDAALEVKRHKLAGAWMVFGNLNGQRYTKSGWGTMWRRMMEKMVAKYPEFRTFTLEDCRPGGVTSKRERGDLDTIDATMHSDSRMVERVYDRRRDRTAKPAK